MAKFTVKVMGPRGPQSIQIIAANEVLARKIAAKTGRVTAVKKQIDFSIERGLSISERHQWMLRMSSMMGGSLGTSNALRVIITNYGGKIKKMSEAMLVNIESGMSVPEAMELDRRNFPPTTTALVKAGAASGSTHQALRDAAQFEYKMSTAHRGSMKQVYSAIGNFLMAGGMMLGTTEIFGPMVMDNPMFKNAEGVDIEWARTFGDVCSMIMIVLMCIFAVFALFGTLGRQIIPDIADKIILKIPYYKDLILSRQNHVTLYKLGLLIKSGVSYDQALTLTEQTSPRGALKADLGRAIRAVKNGKPWAAAMDTLHATDKAALSTSTNREDISMTLNMLAEQYSELYIQRISTFAPLMAGIAAIFITLAGVVLFIQTILPMLQMSAGAA